MKEKQKGSTPLDLIKLNYSHVTVDIGFCENQSKINIFFDSL